MCCAFLIRLGRKTGSMILPTSTAEMRLRVRPLERMGKQVKKRTPLMKISLVPACARMVRRSLRSAMVPIGVAVIFEAIKLRDVIEGDVVAILLLDHVPIGRASLA